MVLPVPSVSVFVARVNYDDRMFVKVDRVIVSEFFGDVKVEKLDERGGGEMKMRATSKNGVAVNGATPYPMISSSYWQPAPVPSPYLIPGRCHDFPFHRVGVTQTISNYTYCF